MSKAWWSPLLTQLKLGIINWDFITNALVNADYCIEIPVHHCQLQFYLDAFTVLRIAVNFDMN